MAGTKPKIDRELLGRVASLTPGQQRWLRTVLQSVFAMEPERPARRPVGEESRRGRPRRAEREPTQESQRQPGDLDDLLSGDISPEDYPELADELKDVADIADLLRESGQERRRFGEEIMRLFEGSGGSGEDDPQQAEVNELREKVEEANMPEEVKERALKEVDRMSRIPTASPEVGVIRTYVDWLVALPWDKSSEDNLDIKQAAVVLDEDHYGLEKIKERILEYLSVRSLADTIRSPILALASRWRSRSRAGLTPTMAGRPRLSSSWRRRRSLSSASFRYSRSRRPCRRALATVSCTTFRSRGF